MKLSITSSLSALLFGAASTADAADILLTDFTEGTAGWEVSDDAGIPGSETSMGIFETSEQSGLSVFVGQVVNKDSIDKPGFVKIRSTDGGPYPDISSCSEIAITLFGYDDYAGFYFAFSDSVPEFPQQFLTEWRVNVKTVSDHIVRELAFPISAFSSKWDFITGEITASCADDPSACATDSVLANIKTLEFWAQGKASFFASALASIRATGCTTATDAE